MNELKKYEVAGLVQEQLMKEQDETFKILNEAGEALVPFKKSPQTMKDAIKNIITESLLNEQCLTNGYGYEETIPVKYRKIRTISQSITDVVWRVLDSVKTNGEAIDDEEIKKLQQQTFIPYLKLLAKKLVDLLNEPDAVTPPVKDKEIVAVTLVPTETIVSPQNKEYAVESIQGNMVFLKDKKDGSLSKVDLTIAKKWKNNK